MLAFGFAVFFLIITPGPAVLSLAGVGASFSFNSGLKFLTGLAIGHIAVSILVITGIASVIFSLPYMRTVFLLISTSFLFLLSYKIITRGSNIAFSSHLAIPSTFDGIVLQLMNPKAYAVHTIVFSGFSIFPDSFLFETIWKFLVMNAIWLPLHFAWLAAGSSIQRISLAPATHNKINMTMGGLLFVTALLSFLSIRTL